MIGDSLKLFRYIIIMKLDDRLDFKGFDWKKIFITNPVGCETHVVFFGSDSITIAECDTDRNICNTIGEFDYEGAKSFFDALAQDGKGKNTVTSISKHPNYNLIRGMRLKDE